MHKDELFLFSCPRARLCKVFIPRVFMPYLHLPKKQNLSWKILSLTWNLGILRSGFWNFSLFCHMICLPNTSCFWARDPSVWYHLKMSLGLLRQLGLSLSLSLFLPSSFLPSLPAVPCLFSVWPLHMDSPAGKPGFLHNGTWLPKLRVPTEKKRKLPILLKIKPRTRVEYSIR